MTQFGFVAQIGAGWGPLGTDIRDLNVVMGADGPVILATTGPGGGLLSLEFDGSTLSVRDTVYFSQSIGQGVTGETAFVGENGQSYAIVSVAGSGVAVGYGVDDSGNINAAATLGLDLYVGDSGPVIATSAAGYIYTTSAPGVLTGYAQSGASYTQVGQAVDTSFVALADPVALEVAQVGGSEFLVALSDGDVGVTVLEIASSGGLTLTATAGNGNGLGLLSNPTDMQIVEVAGATYVLVSSAANSGAGGALSVLELRPDGTLFVTDHVLDSLHTRFGTAATVEAITVGDWTYVVAGGGDAGLSLFALAPGGRLLHLDTIADTQAAGLETISALSLVAAGADLTIFAASQASQGLAQLSVDLSAQGSVIEAGNGNATGQSLNDLILGGIGSNVLQGKGGDDILMDGFGEDTLWGGTGADVFVLERDGVRDEIRDFEAGIDTIDLSAVPFLYDASRLEIIERPWGIEMRFPGGETTAIRAMNGGPISKEQILEAIVWNVDRPALSLINQLIGNEFNNALDGTAGTDIIQGLGNNDMLRGFGGDDRLEGGFGFDTLIGGAGNDQLYGGLGRDWVEGGDGDDMIEDRPQGGYLGQDTIYGGGGNDTISAGGGWDLVHGDDGHDWVFAGWGHDTVIGGTGNDTLFGVGGFDSIEGQGGNDQLFGGNGNDRLDGGTGNDTIIAGSNADYVLGGAGDDQIEGQHGFDTLFGGNGNDWIHGGLFNDRLFGEAGNDTLNGGNDRDRLEGGQGNDLLIGGTGADTLLGGYGADHLLGGNQSDTLEGGFGNDTLEGQNGADVIYGGFGNDLIDGGDMADTISGGGGNDTIRGGSGPDLVYMDDGADLFIDLVQAGMLGRDTVYGGNGNDTILAAAGNDLLFGGGDNDLIRGGGGNDTLQGDWGNDTLDGGANNDRLTGGAGADTFVFRTNDGQNTITDFTPGVDVLELAISETGFHQLSLVAAPRGLWVEWNGGVVLLEGLDAGDITASDVIFV